MIIDSHCHIFEKWTGACGLPSNEIHLHYIQKASTSSPAKVYRLRDGASSDAAICFNGEIKSWENMRDDINFRVGPNGRLEFIHDGDVHYVQYMPVEMAEIESTPERLIAHMNSAGIEHCVLQAGFGYGYMNSYHALAQNQFPGRFSGLFHVDEARADTQEWIAETRNAIENLKLRGLYYHLDQFSRYNFDTWFDEERFDEFWNLIETAELPVFLEFTAIPDYDRTSLISLFSRFEKHMNRFKQIKWVMVMSPPIQYFTKNGVWKFPEEALSVYTHENVFLEVCYPISWGGVWDYPYPEAQKLIEGLRSTFGSEKLIWGSDMPNVGRFCTYKQSLDYVRNYCDFFSDDELDRVLGGNIARLLDITGINT